MGHGEGPAMSESFLSSRIDAGTWPFAVGDVLAILVVVAVGMVRHYGATGVAGDPLGVVLTALPFLVGWAVAAPLVGAYSAGAGESAKASIPLVIRSWVVADVLGIAIRGAQSDFNFALGIFFLVMLAVGAVALAGWRWLFFQVR